MWESQETLMRTWLDSVMLASGDSQNEYKHAHYVLEGFSKAITPADEFYACRDWVIEKISYRYSLDREAFMKKAPRNNKNGKNKNGSSASVPPNNTLNIAAVSKPPTAEQLKRRNEKQAIRRAAYGKYNEFSFVSKEDDYWKREKQPNVSATLIRLHADNKIAYAEASKLMNAFGLCRLCWGAHLQKDHKAHHKILDAVRANEPHLVERSKN